MTTKTDRRKPSRGDYEPPEHPTDPVSIPIAAENHTRSQSRKLKRQPKDSELFDVLPRPPSALKSNGQYENVQISPRHHRYMGITRESSFIQSNV